MYFYTRIVSFRMGRVIHAHILKIKATTLSEQENNMNLIVQYEPVRTCTSNAFDGFIFSTERNFPIQMKSANEYN